MSGTNKDPAQIEEQALDALLCEVAGTASPPDLTRDILQQLRETPLEVAPVLRRPQKAQKQRVSKNQETSRRKQITVAVAVVASLAATLMAAIWLRGDRQVENVTVAESGVDQEWLDTHFPMDRAAADDSNTTAADSSRSIALVNPDTTPSAPKQNPSTPAVDIPSSQPNAPVQAVALVSKQVDSQVRQYWSNIGIDPSPQARSEEIVKRLSTVLGVRLPADAVGNPQRLQKEFAKNQAARMIASRWLEQISDRGLFRVEEESRKKLIGDLAGCFQSKRQFDETLARWISQQSPNSPAFYAALSSGAKDYAASGPMVRRMGALTMNVDLRCIRCHDSHISGDGRQQDYWAFAAFLRRGLAKDPAAVRPTFYDLPDGRRKMAEPGITTKWIGGHSSASNIDIKQWSRQLIGSDGLARGVVNSLWQLVHGQPLQGRVVDPISAPHNEALDRLEDELAEDLVASGFDVGRTLAMIVASPVTQRAVPKPLLPENALVANESDMRSAMDAVDAFAASLPTRPRSGINARADEAMRAIGMKLSADGQSFVAQIGDGGKVGAPSAASKALSVDFPYRAEELPVQWLGSIKDKQSRVDHIGYLAGFDRLPIRVSTSAESMKEAEVDETLILHRIWWMLRK